MPELEPDEPPELEDDDPPESDEEAPLDEEAEDEPELLPEPPEPEEDPELALEPPLDEPDVVPDPEPDEIVEASPSSTGVDDELDPQATPLRATARAATDRERRRLACFIRCNRPRRRLLRRRLQR